MRSTKSEQALRLRVQQLEGALAQLGLAQCFCCGSWYRDLQNILTTTGGSLCVDCIAWHEEALEDVQVSHHDTQRLSIHLAHQWQGNATVTGVRMIGGFKVDTTKPSKVIDNVVRLAWAADCVLWDYVTAKGLAICNPQTGRPLIHDPRNFAFDQSRILRLKPQTQA